MTRIAALVAAALAWVATDAAAINKCVDASGKVVYQDEKCPEGAKADVVKPPPPRSSKGAGGMLSPEEDVEDPRLLDLVASQALYESCAELPGFATANGAVYEAWRSRNAEHFSRIERSRRYQEVLERARRQTRAQFANPGVSRQLANFCEAQFIPVLKNNTVR